jgi:hypothetical protein
MTQSTHNAPEASGRDHGAGLGLVPGNRQRLGKARLARHRSVVGEVTFGYLQGHDTRSAPALRSMVHGRVPRLVVCKATARPVLGGSGGPVAAFNAPERPPERERRYAATPSSFRSDRVRGTSPHRSLWASPLSSTERSFDDGYPHVLAWWQALPGSRPFAS